MEKVLLVDDDQAFLDILSERMRNRGMAVTTVPSAAAALEKLSADSYDAVLLDLMMPEMGGIEALKLMLDRRPETQVILLTGHPSVSKGVEAMKLGAVDFIPKPVDIAELTDKIKQAKVSRVIMVDKRSRANAERER